MVRALVMAMVSAPAMGIVNRPVVQLKPTPTTALSTRLRSTKSNTNPATKHGFQSWQQPKCRGFIGFQAMGHFLCHKMFSATLQHC